MALKKENKPRKEQPQSLVPLQRTDPIALALRNFRGMQFNSFENVLEFVRQQTPQAQLSLLRRLHNVITAHIRQSSEYATALVDVLEEQEAAHPDLFDVKSRDYSSTMAYIMNVNGYRKKRFGTNQHIIKSALEAAETMLLSPLKEMAILDLRSM